MKKYNKAKGKMINFDDVTKENIKKIKIGQKFIITHAQY